MVRRRKSTRTKTSQRRSTSRKSASKSSKPNSAQLKLKERQTPPWKRIDKLGLYDPQIYTIPWGVDVSKSGLTYLSGIGYVGEKYNDSVDDYKAQDYSWESFIISQVVGYDSPHEKGENEDCYKLRDDQVQDANSVISAYNAKAPEFLIANKTGTGKTVTTWATVKQIAPKRALIICPQAVIPVWRQHITDMGDRGINVVIINYESLKKLICPPDSAVSSKKTATQNKHVALHGDPYCYFDLVVLDEAHKVKNPTSQQSRIAAKFCDHAKFSLKLSATPGKDPSQLHYLWKGLSWATGEEVRVEDENDFSSYIKWCRKNNIGGKLKPAPFGVGLKWEGDKKDLLNMSKIIYGKSIHNAKWATKRKRDDTQTIRESLPINLSATERQEYGRKVEDAKKSVLEIAHSGSKDVKAGMGALMAMRQKAGVLKCPEIVDYAKYCIDDLGEQVVITTVFHNTSDVLSKLLDKKKIKHVLINGRMSAQEKEEARLKFQSGEVPVVISSITTGISLHANENARTSSCPRRMIVADLQWSPSEHTQLEGRINRNGESGVITIPYLHDTVDEKVTKSLLKGMTSQSLIQSDFDNANNVEMFAKIMGIDLGM